MAGGRRRLHRPVPPTRSWGETIVAAVQALWRRQSWAGPLADGAAIALAVLVAGLALIAVIVKEPRLYRPVLAAAIVFNLVIVARRWPRAAIATTLMLLPFLALLRRLLISRAGWTGNDPLLLVAPLLAIYLLGAVYVVAKRPVPKDLADQARDRARRLLVLAGVQPDQQFGLTGRRRRSAVPRRPAAVVPARTALRDAPPGAAAARWRTRARRRRRRLRTVADTDTYHAPVVGSLVDPHHRLWGALRRRPEHRDRGASRSARSRATPSTRPISASGS